MNSNIKNKFIRVILLIIIAWVIYRFFNSSIFETMIANGNEEIKDFVKKSFCWGLCFGAIIAILIKYAAKLLQSNHNL